MAGWFYAPGPQPPQLQPSVVGPTDTAIGTTNPIVDRIPQTNALVRSTWGPESWSAQRGATVASQIAAPQIIVPPVPHLGLNRFRTTLAWHNRDYALVFPNANVSGVTAVAPPPPQSVAYAPYSFAAIRAVWPEPQWEAQAESTLASIFATPANQTSVPSPSDAVPYANILASWPQEDWRALSESAIASGLSPVAPAVVVPQQTTIANLIAGGQLWPRETWNVQSNPRTIAWLPTPIIATPAPVPHPEISLWPQAQWNAQQGADIAGQLATASQQIPPLPVGMLSNIIGQWPRDQWAAQTGPNVAGYLAPVKPPTFVNNPPLSTAILAQIVGSWPQPDWYTQSEDNVGSQLAQVPSIVPRSPKHEIQDIWPRDDWRTQSAAPTAALIAQQQVPPLYIPQNPVPGQMALVGTWPREDWAAQFAPPRAAWIPPPVIAIPAPPPHIERLLWQQEQWSAQTGADVASGLAGVVNPQPKAPTQQQIVSIWTPEAWNAQTGPNVASQLALVFDIPFIPTPLRTLEIMSWPQEQWSAQNGSNGGSTASITPISIFPSQPAALQTIRPLWAAESWDAQRGARNAASFAQAPKPVPFINRAIRAEINAMWPREEWKAQSAPRLADLFAAVAPPIPPVPPVVVKGRPANLGYKVTSRTFNLAEMVSRAWGGEFKAPDHRVYTFSNGRSFDSTDIGDTGFYRKK